MGDGNSFCYARFSGKTQVSMNLNLSSLFKNMFVGKLKLNQSALLFGINFTPNSLYMIEENYSQSLEQQGCRESKNNVEK